MKAKKFKMIVKLCSMLAAIVVFVLTIVSITQFVQMAAMIRKKSRLEKKLDYLNQTEGTIKENILKHNDINYSEQYAREHLGFIKDGDIIYEID